MGFRLYGLGLLDQGPEIAMFFTCSFGLEARASSELLIAGAEFPPWEASNLNTACTAWLWVLLKWCGLTELGL